MSKKAPPPPEGDTILRGSAAVSGSANKELEKLQNDARRSGDRSKLIAYQSRLKVKAV